MTLAMKILPRLPARVEGGGPIVAIVENGILKITYDVTGLGSIALSDATTSFVTIYDADSGNFGNLTVAALIAEISQNLDPFLAALIGASTGILVKSGSGSVESREIAGTANEIAVSNGDGISANPTVSLPPAITLTGKTVTGGTFSGPAISSPTGITKADVGLGNVDNTSDVNKPVSTAQGAADALRLLLAGGTMTGFITLHADPAAAMNPVTKQYSDSGVQTLSNKTLDAPVITNPSGLTKADVGLGNVDNTSDATKNAAVATLTNKTLTAPVINSPTGLVKGDVGLGNVDNTSDATKNSAAATLTNKTINGASNTLQVREADLNLSDNTTNDASTTKHGLLPKLPGGTTSYLRADGAWATPAGGGGGGGDVSSDTASSSVNGVVVFRDGGGTLIGEPDGPVNIGFDPVGSTDAATKQYVDTAIAAIPDPVAMAIVFGS